MRAQSVVVVEDDPAILLDATTMFEEAGFKVLSFTNADDALACIYESGSDIAAVFTDLQMPGRMDGLVLAEIVGRHWPKMPVLLTSGRVRPMTSLPDNVTFIAKPWSHEAVLAALDQSRTAQMVARA